MKAMPMIPGRAAQHRGGLMLFSVSSLLLCLLFGFFAWKQSFLKPEGVWLTLFWAALVLDAWASVTGLREAGQGTPRAFNRCDLAASLLAAASIAVGAFVLVRALSTMDSVPATARATGLMLFSVLVLGWLVRRARLRARLPAPLRGWPLGDRGKPRIPARVADVTGTKTALALFALPLTSPAMLSVSPIQLFVPIAACLAAESAALTRRATDAWWERPAVGFSGEDFVALLLGCVVLPVGVGAFVLATPAHSGHEWDGLMALYAIVVIVHAATAIARGRRRWIERHTLTGALSIWD